MKHFKLVNLFKNGNVESLKKSLKLVHRNKIWLILPIKAFQSVIIISKIHKFVKPFFFNFFLKRGIPKCHSTKILKWKMNLEDKRKQSNNRISYSISFIFLPLPFVCHRSSTFLNVIGRYSTFFNVIDRSLTISQRDPLFPTIISLNMSLVGQIGSRWDNVKERWVTVDHIEELWWTMAF